MLNTVRGNPMLLRLVISQFTVMLAKLMFMVGLTVVTFGAGGPELLGLALIVLAVIGGIGSVFLTVFAGGHPPQRIIRVGVRLVLLSMLVASSAGWLSGARPLVVIAAGGLLIIGAMLHRAGRLALLPQIAPTVGELASANALSSVADGVGFLLGPLLGALALVVGGTTTAFVAAAVVGVVGVVADVGTTAPEGRGRAIAAEGVRVQLRDQGQSLSSRVVKVSLLMLVAQTFMSGALGVAYGSLALDRLDMGDAGVGILQAGYGAGAAVTAVVLFRLVGARRLGLLTSIGLAAWAGGIMLLAPASTPVAGVAALVVVGSANATFDLAIFTLLQRSVPEALLTGVFGMLEFSVVLGVGLGAAASPVLYRELGLPTAFLVIGGVGMFAAVVALRFMIRLDAEDAAPQDRVETLRRTAIFGLLPSRALGVLALRATTRTAGVGERFITKGEAATSCFVIVSGTVEVDVDGHVIDQLSTSAVVGEIALTRGEVRTASVVALTPTTLLEIERVALRAATGGRDGGLIEISVEDRLAHPAHATGRSPLQ